MTGTAPAHFNPARLFQWPQHERCAGLCHESSHSAIEAKSRFSGRVAVVTAEGDRITLSANLAESFRSVVYQGFTRSTESEAQSRSESAGYRTLAEFGVTVEGDLSERELQDLMDLFGTIKNIFRTFLSGRGEEAFVQTVGMADGFGRFTTLAELNLDLHVQRSVTVATAGQSVIDPAAPSKADTPGVAPPTQTAIPSSSTGTTAPTQLVPYGSEQPFEALAEQLFQAVEDSRVRRETLRRFLARLLEKAEQDAEADTEGEVGEDKKAAAAETGKKVLERFEEEPNPIRHVVAAVTYRRTVTTHDEHSFIA